MPRYSSIQSTQIFGAFRIWTSRLFCALALGIAGICPAIAQRKTISRSELEDLLAHSVTIALLNEYCKTPDGFYPNTNIRIVDEAELTSPPDPGFIYSLLKEDLRSGNLFARYQDMLRLIRNVRPKLISDAVSQWGRWDWPVHLARCHQTIADIKAIDSAIVVQASMNEFVDNGTAGAIGIIPPWVWEAFGMADEHRRFDIYKMMFADWSQHKQNGIPQRWWDEYGMENGKPKAIVPDIRTREAQMWFYYQGRMFIDMGCESLSFHQVDLMNDNKHDPTHWNVVFEKLRAYADTKPDLRYLLITGHTNGMRDAAGNLIFDFHSSPTRPSELGTNIDASGGDCNITAESCEWREGTGKIYGRSLGGRVPSGWHCTSLPGMVFIDNYGANDPSQLGKPMGTGTCDIYHFDEISWFASQDKGYRDRWLRYAYARVRDLDAVIYFALPIKRGPTYKDHWYPADYLANNPRDGILDVPRTIGNVPDGDIDRATVQLYCGYGQEDVIKDILATSRAGKAAKATMQLGPNPASIWTGVLLNRHGPASTNSCTVLDMQGRALHRGDFKTTSYRIDVSGLTAGPYIVIVRDGEQQFVRKLLVQK